MSLLSLKEAVPATHFRLVFVAEIGICFLSCSCDSVYAVYNNVAVLVHMLMITLLAIIMMMYRLPYIEGFNNKTSI